MRFGVRVLAVAALIGAAAMSTIGQAGAGSTEIVDEEQPATRAAIDENGNLIVYHASGYKQIIIGGGDVLKRNDIAVDELFAERAPAEGSPSVIHLGDADRVSANSVMVVRPPLYEDPVVVRGDCVYGTAIVRGRSFMHGVDRNQTPVIANDCN